MIIKQFADDSVLSAESEHRARDQSGGPCRLMDIGCCFHSNRRWRRFRLDALLRSVLIEPQVCFRVVDKFFAQAEKLQLMQTHK